MSTRDLAELVDEDVRRRPGEPPIAELRRPENLRDWRRVLVSMKSLAEQTLSKKWSYYLEDRERRRSELRTLEIAVQDNGMKAAAMMVGLSMAEAASMSDGELRSLFEARIHQADRELRERKAFHTKERSKTVQFRAAVELRLIEVDGLLEKEEDATCEEQCASIEDLMKSVNTLVKKVDVLQRTVEDLQGLIEDATKE